MRAAVFLAAVSLVGACSSSPVTDASTTSSSSATSITPVPVSTTTSTPPAIPMWVRAAVDSSNAWVMNTVVAFGDRLIAAGLTTSQHPAVWTSSDGLTWTQVAGAADLAVPRGTIYDLAVGGPGLVAVGAAGTDDGFIDAAVWTSSNGLDWSRVPHNPEVFGGPGIDEIRAVAAGPAGLVAVGYAQPYSDAAVVWHSVDGVEWSRVPDDDLPVGSIADVTYFSGGFAAVGTAALGYPDESAAVWLSPDGREWSQVVLPASNRHRLDSVTTFGGSLIAVGSDGLAATAVVWSSEDGVEWTRIRDRDFGGPGMFDQGRAEMRAVITSGDGLVAIGSIQESGWSDGAVWRSTDGVLWSRDDTLAFGGRYSQDLYAVAEFGGGIVAVGVETAPEAVVAAAWLIGPSTAAVPTTTTTSAPLPTTVTPGAPEFLMRCGDRTSQYESPPPVTYPDCAWRATTDPFWVLARWELDPAHPPDPSGSILHILATETACAGGAVPEGREIRSVLMSAGNEIVLFVLIEPSDGPMTCPGNPSFPMTIDLGKPLREVTVFEGFLVPPLALYPDE